MLLFVELFIVEKGQVRSIRMGGIDSGLIFGWLARKKENEERTEKYDFNDKKQDVRGPVVR